MPSRPLTPTLLAAFAQCPRRLWFQACRPDLAEGTGQSCAPAQAGFDVREAARSLYVKRTVVPRHESVQDAVTASRSALSRHPRRVLLDGVFWHENVLVRVDALIPARRGMRLVAFRAATSVKERHVAQCALQAWVLTGAEIAVDAVEVAHVDTAFVYAGDERYQGLFHHEPIDAAVDALQASVAVTVDAARRLMSRAEPPMAPRGSQCHEPQPCPFRRSCNVREPETQTPAAPAYPLETLPYLRATTRDHLHSVGVQDARHVPEAFLNPLQRRVQRCFRSDAPYLDNQAAEVLNALPYPRFYLDFETVQFAVPRWPGTSPWRTQVPFQWSCHVQPDESTLRHAEFLDVSGDDPRRRFAQSLLALLGASGPVFVYYQSFEKSRIAELATCFPDLAEALHAINARIVDLLPLTRRSYFHPDMRGSWSLKAVHPTLPSGKQRDRLPIADGSDAQAAYRAIVHPGTAPAQRHALRLDLRRYCALDTLAMVELVQLLTGRHPWRQFRSDRLGAGGRDAPKDGLGPGACALLPAALALLERESGRAGDRFIPVTISWLQRSLKAGYRATHELLHFLEAWGVLEPRMTYRGTVNREELAFGENHHVLLPSLRGNERDALH